MGTNSTRNIYISEIDRIKKSEKKIIVFGAMLLGKMSKKLVESLEKSVECYCDNMYGEIEWDENITGEKTVDGIPVITPCEMREKYDDALILISVFSKKSLTEITNQLKELGFVDVISSAPIRFGFQTICLERGLDENGEEILAKTIEESYFKSKEDLYFNDLGVIITEFCNLRCKNCGLQIPYIKNPRHYDIAKSILGVKRFLSDVAVGTGIMSISGGEPMLHPGIIEIARELAKIPQIIQINIITNGAWVPNETILGQLSKYVSRIQIADYGSASPNRYELAKACDKIGIMHEHKLEIMSTWCDTGAYCSRNRTEDEMINIFQNCKFHIHIILCEGKLYRCARIPLGLCREGVQINESDSISFLDEYKCEDKFQETKRYLIETKYVSMCNYCDGTNGKEIPAGEQM